MATIEEAILQRSYLPKDGTYTMVDHILAMDMHITGTNVDYPSISEEVTYLKVQENQVTTDIKEGIISINIEPKEVNILVGVEETKVVVEDE
jgi:hypothetical protein